MKVPALPFSPEENEEILALIATLHHAHQRLEVLTLGEVDTVTDLEGRQILLPSSQESFRFSVANKQAAILNAMPGQIAILDTQGNILVVNEGWEKFALKNEGLALTGSLGGNFLVQCEQAKGHGAPWGMLASTGIRAVLEGYEASFSLEYPSHLTSDQRWFLLIVTPLPGGPPNGVVAIQIDISERKKAEVALQESERRFSDMLENVQLISVMLDCTARVTYCNDYLLNLTGWTREEVLGEDWFNRFISPDLHHLKGTFFQDILAGKLDAMHDENEILSRSGAHHLIRWNNTVLRSSEGNVIGTASIGEDITGRREASERIRFLNRVYAVLSGINTMIVRASDRDGLFREACRIAVEDGGFRMSMIAMADPTTGLVLPVASAGKEDLLLTAIHGVLSSPEIAPTSMTVRAMNNKTVLVANDAQSDPQVLVRDLYTAAGVGSMAVFPLVVASESVGVLALYANEVGFFREEELKLLKELTSDIEFAMDHLDKHAQLNYLAYYDVLTGLANHSLFLERVAQYIHSALASKHKLALFLIDLERFKNINDSLGRPVGDELLRQVAMWLTRHVGDANLVARIGADHFAVVLPVVSPENDLPRILEKMVEAFLNHSFHLNSTVYRIAARGGVSIFPDDGSTAEALYMNAEAALKRAKGKGERFLFYAAQMNETVAGRVTLENQLRQALDNDEFVLHYQPKVNLVTGRVSSCEALIRWNDPRTGLVPPGKFIPVLEETGMIHNVGRWAVHQAVKDYLRWRDAGLVPVRIAVNVSPLQLRNRGFIAEIREALSVDPRASEGLELEITESLIMEDVKHTIHSLEGIRGLGVSVAIDDFGTGFSSLSYLSRLPVDTLKIDRSFVVDMTEGPEGLSLVSTIIHLAHSLKLKIVAEGVETEEQSRLLRLLNCDEMQGFLFSKPVPGEVFEEKFLRPPAVNNEESR